MNEQIIRTLENYLDTRDKRYMFLKCMFPDDLPLINTEGSPREVALSIYRRFENNNMLGSLSACLNKVFETDITINYPIKP